MTKQSEILSAQMRQLLNASNVSIVTSTLLALVLSYVQHEVISSTVIYSWLSLIVLVAYCRIALANNYKKFPVEDYPAIHARLVNFRLGVLAVGVAWGSAGIFLFPAQDPQHQMFLIFMLAGLTAGGVVAYSADFVSAISFSLPALLPIVIRLLVGGETLQVAMSISTMLYLVFMIMSLRYISANIKENIVLRLESATSEARYRLLLSHTPVGIFHFDTKLVITYCNDRFAEILHSRVEHITGMDIKGIDCHEFIPAMQKTFDREHGFYEGYCHSKFSNFDGWISMSCAPILDGNGNFLGGIGIVQDITDRLQANEAIRNSAQKYQLLFEKYQLLFESSRDALMTLSPPTWKFSGANLAAMQLYGASTMAEFTAVEPWVISPERQSDGRLSSEKAQEMIAIAMREGSHFFEWDHQRLDGNPFTADVLLTRMKLGEDVFLQATVRNISSRKILEKEIRESRQLLRELAEKAELLKEEERKHIAREVHDELGQILTALRMDVALINLRFGENNSALVDKTQSMTELLNQAGRCVNDIVSNLRPSALDMGIVPAVGWLCNEYAAHTGRACVLQTNTDQIDLDEVLAVAAFRIVQELLTNASRHAKASNVKIILTRGADDLQVEVRDNGTGFDPAIAITNRSYGLLGIRERVIALGGQINLVSAPSKGTVVTIMIPVKPSGEDT